MERLSEKLWSWASEIDDGTIRQAERTARLAIVFDHVALMPDAHLGIGATVGSVIPTENAIIPSAVGVDIGCGMIAARINRGASELPDDLGAILTGIEGAVPAGVGKGHDDGSPGAGDWLAAHRPATGLDTKQAAKAAAQFGTLGSGNHFVELCLDEEDRIWLVLHSGSRGIGNQLAQRHIGRAKALAKEAGTPLDDPDLAWFTQGTADFDAYIADMLWAQDYAMANRQAMLHAASRVVLGALPSGSRIVEQVNCHHNFAAEEIHDGRRLWITRKGAVRARAGERGVIPGSMGTSSYVVSGLGSAASWQSSSHGAGRRMSRGEARRRFSAEDLGEAMAGKTWLADRAGSLVDEIPASYKDIDQVMADQADLVRVEHTLHQVLNYKGT
ncbi:MAG: RtcB family protein [Actinomycetota bacterium]|nr:RtcB family protein [Actinomycetota bacterium]